MQTATSSTTAVGVFTNKNQADRAVDALFNAGFTSGQIGVVSRDHADYRPAPKTAAANKTADGENAATGAAAGAVAGAGIGALVGWGVLAGAIPVVGPALFAGTLGVLASNAAGGAAALGLVGALTGWGISEEHAKHYESEIAAGRVLVSVTSTDRCDTAKAILKQYGATSKDPACSC